MSSAEKLAGARKQVERGLRNMSSYRQRQAERGLVQLCMWVPAADAQTIRDYAQKRVRAMKREQGAG
jgi:hypothetical protein